METEVSIVDIVLTSYCSFSALRTSLQPSLACYFKPIKTHGRVENLPLNKIQMTNFVGKKRLQL